jgi:hypothetical protein
MNTKKIIGIGLWIVAFWIPFKFSLLSTEKVDNITGLVSFVVLVALVFTGYVLVDGSSKGSEEHGH